jgi:hypothetical protein
MTPEMLAVLRAELTTDPSSRGYAGKSAEDAAALLNASYFVAGAPSACDVGSANIQKIIVPTGELFKITRTGAAALDGTAKDALIGAAWSFSEMLSRWSTIETSNPDTWKAAQASMAALEASGLLSAASIAAITALVEVTPPPVEQHARIMEIFIQSPVEFPDDFTRYEATAADVQEALS